MSFHVPEELRVTYGKLNSSRADGRNGAFLFRSPVDIGLLRAIASDGGGWEHVSVSRGDRCPTWKEMGYVKSRFWDAEDWVVEFHPAASEYVNHHPYCLHLWRPIGVDFPKPPSIFVGPKPLTTG